MSKRSLVLVIALAVITSVIGIVISLSIDWFPVQASTQAKDIDRLYDVLLGFSVPIFVLVVAVLAYSFMQFRQRPGQENEDGTPIHGNTKLEVIWTLIPALLLFGLIGYAYVVLQDIEKPKPNPLNVKVTGEQFTWTFEYPQYKRHNGQPLRTTDLYLPKGRPVQFTVTTKDVLHDFWVPAFRMKIDSVPGINTHIKVTPTRLGKYPVVCAELCGLGHSVMRSATYVVPADRFKRWVADQRKPPSLDGRQIFTDSCASCHTLKAASATGAIGPDLDKTLKGQSKAAIEESILGPDAKIAAGYQKGVMPPNFGQTLSEEEQRALVNYLGKVSS